jgi:hypothetical protein
VLSVNKSSHKQICFSLGHKKYIKKTKKHCKLQINIAKVSKIFSAMVLFFITPTVGEHYSLVFKDINEHMYA